MLILLVCGSVALCAAAGLGFQLGFRRGAEHGEMQAVITSITTSIKNGPPQA